MKIVNTIRIPEPCGEDWNAMRPEVTGRFCSSCSKTVLDFTGKTDPEINGILAEHKDQKVCGRFKKSQIDRPLTAAAPAFLPKLAGVTRAFAIALFLVFGSLLFSCKDEQGKDVYLKGMVLPQPADIHHLLDSVRTVTDSSACMAQETVPADELAYEGAVSGAIAIETVTAPEPYVKEVVPEEMIMGIMRTDFPGKVPVKDSVAKDSVPSLLKANDELAEKPRNLEFRLYPNPTSREFTISYELLKPGDVTIKLFNMSGALVKELVAVKGQHSGNYRIPFDAGDLPSGIYLVNMIGEGKQTTERLVIAR